MHGAHAALHVAHLRPSHLTPLHTAAAHLHRSHFAAPPWCDLRRALRGREQGELTEALFDQHLPHLLA